jgi:hypothetical protein
MSETIAFDIETYRPSWQISQTRREDFNPESNTVITAGFSDGKETSIYPTVQDLKKENEPVRFLLRKLEEAESSVLVGYNILHFDIPYLVHKSKSIGKGFDTTRLKLLDLYWILPYWFHNIPSGQEFFNRNPTLGNICKFEDVVKYILNREANPISNKDIHRLWEAKRFQDIESHLKLDLAHTFSLFMSPTIKESLNHVYEHKFDKHNCEESCPFQRPLQKTSNTTVGYCALLCEVVTNEKEMSTIDVICYPLPQRDSSWIPRCLEG